MASDNGGSLIIRWIEDDVQRIRRDVIGNEWIDMTSNSFVTTKSFSHIGLRVLIAAVSVLIGTARVMAQGDPVVSLAELTSAHTRVVWVQDQSSTNGDTLALGRELKLMGFDSADGRGERAILDSIQNYAKPLLTPDGKRVVFSDRFSKEVFVVNWDGTGRRRLGKGFAVEVWKDPQSDETWVYVCTQLGQHNSINFRALRRIPLDGASRWETVWDRTEISPDNFQLSADGTFAAGEFPWPNGGTAVLAEKTYRKRADGCWASLAPDNSGLCWVFDGPHRNVYLYPRDCPAGWKVNINAVPGFDGYEGFHPRWSNHVRFFCMTGPYKVKTNLNHIAGGGPEVEVYVGRFSDDFRTVERWARVTRNGRGDFHPDVWIAGGETTSIPAEVFRLTAKDKPLADQWPGTTTGLEFLWDNAAAQNVIARPGDETPRMCRVQPRGRARYNRYFDMDCTNGSFVAEQFGRELLDTCQKTNEFTIEAAITTGRADQSGPAPIIAFSSSPKSRNFILGQDHDSLILELNLKTAADAGKVTARLGKLTAGQLQHVVLTLSASKLNCYLDGKPIVLSAAARGDLSGWTEQPLVFGDEYSGGRHNWSGRLEGIAIFSRALTEEEAVRQFELFSARLDNRTPPEQLRVRAKCLETSTIPNPHTIVPYRRALIINRYKVEKVLAGSLERPEILVAQWGILDKSVVPDAKIRAGQTAELTLEIFDEHPELKSERQIVDIEGLDLPWFYAVSK
jgi:Concanavalin A-like lectin/glucanases superfamily